MYQNVSSAVNYRGNFLIDNEKKRHGEEILRNNQIRSMILLNVTDRHTNRYDRCQRDLRGNSIKD